MSLRSRFRGCLVGAVVGDCLGAPFEVTGVRGGPGNYQNMVDKLGVEMKQSGPMRYTDDTAMTRCLADSLIHTGGILKPDDLALRFAEEYKKSPCRGYGGNVVTVLERLDESGIDVFKPARQQFDGSGSYGNGGAMRVSPAALCHKDGIDTVIQHAKNSALLTHSNPKGYNGAVTQALAVHQALHTPSGTIDAVNFARTLLSCIQEKVENRAKRVKLDRANATDGQVVTGDSVYSDKLQDVISFLQGKEDVPPTDVVAKLGNDVFADESVVTAIYSFLRCLTAVEGLETENPLERTVLYAISLCGDTDTIASMAGAIAGSYYGIEMVPEKWQDVCEGVEKAKEQADGLYNLLERTTDEGVECNKLVE